MKKIVYFISMFVFLFVLEGAAQIPGQEIQRNIKLKRANSIRNQVLTQEQESKVLKYLEENLPQSAKRMKMLKMSNPKLYSAKINKFFRELSYVESLKDTEPARYNQLVEERKLTEKSLMLAEEYKNAKSKTEKAQIKSDLETLLYKLFDYRQINRESEIERLEKRLDELRDANKKRTDNKKLIVEKRLQQLIGEKKYLQW